MAKTTKKKKDYTDDAIELGLGIGGGIAANFATTWLEKQTFMGAASPYASAIVSALGAAAYILVPDPKIKALAFGMAVVGGTETGEMLMAKSGVMAGLGFTDQQLGLGFTGKALPTGDMTFNVGGVAIR